jgi:hypothetical protein
LIDLGNPAAMNLTKLMLLPLFAHLALILIVGQRSLRARIKSVTTGTTKLSDIATNSGAWPSRVKKLGDNFDNQFETPMLWYAVCGLIVALKLEDMVFVVLSWLFLLTRLVHSYVHTTSNDVPSRMRVFLAGFLTLLLMWTWLAVKLFVIG